MANSNEQMGQSFQSIGAYRVLSQLGGYRLPEDGRTATYFCEADGKKFVVKALICSAEFGGAARERFDREGAIGETVGHPAVAVAHEKGPFSRGRFIAYAWQDGVRELGELCAGSQLSPSGSGDRLEFLRQIISYHEQIGRGLHAMHEAGVLHRDVKPSNITVNGATAQLIDFGYSCYIAAPREEPDGVCVGTLPYLAPEYRRSGMATISADVFSLGASLYTCILGASPFDGIRAGERERSERLGAMPRKHWSSIDKSLEAVLIKATEPNPRRRYRTGEELADDLERLLEGKEVRAKPRTARQNARIAFARHPKASLLTLALTVAAAVLGTIAMWTARERNRVLEREVRYIAAFALQDPSRIAIGLNEQQAAMQATLKELGGPSALSPAIKGAAQLIGARHLEALGLPNAALEAALAAAETVQTVAGPKHPLYHEAKVGVANVLLSLGELEQAETLYVEALASLQNSTSPESKVLRRVCQQNQAILQMERGQPEEAMQGFQKILESGEGTELVRGRVRSMLGEVLLRSGLVDDADVVLHQAYRVLSKLEGPSAETTLHVQSRLARVHLGNLEPDLALESMLEVMELAEAAFGPNHAYLASHCVLLGRIYNDLGQPVEAAAFIEEALHLGRKGAQKSFDGVSANSEFVRALLLLGEVDSALGRAQWLIQESDWIRSINPFRDCLLTHNLGVALREAGRAREAVPHLEQAIEGASQLWNWGDARLDKMRLNLALSLADLQLHEAGIYQLACGRLGCRERLETDTWLYGQILAAEGQLQIREQSFEEARVLLEEAFEVLHAHKPISGDTYKACESLAVARFKAGELEEALGVLVRFLEQEDVHVSIQTRASQVIEIFEEKIEESKSNKVN